MISEIEKLFSKKGHSLQTYLFESAHNKENMYNESNMTIHHTLYPYTQRFHNLFNPVFIAELWWIDQFNRVPVNLATDGYINLLNFFFKNPKPGAFTSSLLVDKKFETLIPEAWSKQVSTYEIEASKLSSNSEKNELLIFTLISSATASDDFFKQKYDELISYAKKNSLKVTAVVLCRNNPYDSQYDNYDKVTVERVRLLEREFGKIINFMSWENFLQGSQYNSTIYYKFDQGSYNFSYSYIDHFLLSKGATPFSSKKTSEVPSLSKDLSLFHKINIYESDCDDSKFWKEFNQVVKENEFDSDSIYHSELLNYANQLFEKYFSE